MTMLSKNNQNGRSMVEMLGVLAIIGVLSIGGISGYSKAMAKFKLTKAQDQLTMLLMNIRTAYATSPSYSGLTPQMAADFNIAPNEMVTGTGSGTSLNGAFGGKVELESTGSSNTYFRITMKALGKEACRSLLTSDWGADGLVTVNAGADASSPGTITMPCTNGGSGGHYCTADLPVPMANAASDCNHETNYITWIYY